VLLGLAGDSASGKSTLSAGIEYVLGPDRVGRICTDDYHRYDRAERARRGLTPLAPEANHMDLVAEHLRDLAAGSSVTKPTYDHHDGTFGSDEVFDPREIVIVEGLLPLVDSASREALDVAVFVDPEEELRHRWKLERDVFERGYPPAEVVAELKRREPDARHYVRPQRDVADIVVRFEHGPTPGGPLSARLDVRPTLPYAGLRELLGSLGTRPRPEIRWSTTTDARGPTSVVEIDGDCSPDLGAQIEEIIWSQLRPDDRLQRDRIGVVRRAGQGDERSESLALAQLLIVAFLVGHVDDSFLL
jgi:phosphoribulokinase